MIEMPNSQRSTTYLIIRISLSFVTSTTYVLFMSIEEAVENSANTGKEDSISLTMLVIENFPSNS